MIFFPFLAESPDCVKQLLDTNIVTAKPSYMMAPEHPLVLHECGFDNLNIVSKYLQPKNLWSLAAHFELVWEKNTIAAIRYS
jgi:hypothetical protein